MIGFPEARGGGQQESQGRGLSPGERLKHRVSGRLDRSEWKLSEWKNSESIFADFHKLLNSTLVLCSCF